MDYILEYLREQQVDPHLLSAIEEYRNKNPVSEELKKRIVRPMLPYYGRETFEMAAYALLNGENILLTGSKATGKNILAENLAYVFGRHELYRSNGIC